MSKIVTDNKNILKEYQDLCEKAKKTLTRSEYRKLNTLVSSNMIEKIWGTWTNFVKIANSSVEIRRKNIQKCIKNDKLVITSIQDGSSLNLEALETLEYYCRYNKAELVILWGKALDKREVFSREVSDKINKYLATDVVFERDKSIIIHDYMLSPYIKNPLIHLDKLSTKAHMIITGSTKQYMQVLPYKQEDLPRIAYTTGTISNIYYDDSASKQLDADFGTVGAIILEKNSKNVYYPRNLIYKDGEIRDLDKIYTKVGIKTNEISGIVLGDMHFPEEDGEELNNVVNFIKKYNIKNVFLHDVASWESINHHEAYNFLDKIRNVTQDTVSLEIEYEAVMTKLKDFSEKLKKQHIYIVHSNHDDFIIKWLNDGNFIKDPLNAIFGAELFITYCQGDSIYTKFSEIKNITFLPHNTKFELEGFQLGEHGDKGLSGAHGNPKLFTKAFTKTVTAHTHSPMIFENSIVVGTNSKLKLRYNQNGFTNWAHANVILHKNGTYQMLF